jgi:hypothetical protein
VSVITMVQVPCGDMRISMTALKFTTPKRAGFPSEF